MSDNRSWNDIGKEIRDASEFALRTGDFSLFWSSVSTSIDEAVKSASAAAEKAVAQETAKQSQTGKARQTYTERMAQETRERQRRQREAELEAHRKRVAEYRSSAPFRSIGKVSGTVCQIFGAIGLSIFGILTAVFFGLGIGLGGGFMVAFVPILCCLIGSILLLNSGNSMKKRYERALKYWKLAGNNHYINIEDLALQTNQSKRAVIKDLKKMLADGFYPQGHLDRQQTCLMLDDKIFQEYLNIDKQRKAMQKEQRMQEKQKAQEESAVQTAESTSGSGNPELDAMVAEGQDCIKKLREMNDNIPGEEISAKLFKLENLLKEIFEKLVEHPDQLPQMQKFMRYYLPTTMKLVEAYEEFDNMSNQGPDIIEAKAEIEKTLDSINDAFEELLNRMLRDKAYDVATDAQVLKTMLAQEGLTKDTGFENAPQA